MVFLTQIVVWIFLFPNKHSEKDLRLGISCPSIPVSAYGRSQSFQVKLTLIELIFMPAKLNPNSLGERHTFFIVQTGMFLYPYKYILESVYL